MSIINDNITIDTNDIVVNASTNAETGTQLIPLVDWSVMKNDLDDLIASYVWLEKEYESKKKELVSRIAQCLFKHGVTIVKGSSHLYKSIYFLFAKYQLEGNCSFQHHCNREKYPTDYDFVLDYETACTGLCKQVKLKHSKPGKNFQASYIFHY